ncbi:MAG TPA: SDR family oxidoreductase [Actinophytocola sp.]|uniref:SDR family oxidoreductase n=1 Tax=Actinophytocola sp. TaxID=1872138 RepID=UPI002DDCE48C|nr:SDR family oxidoreductase [Actinophytocola sp.]HEV2784435.1 SDR family oxidoreductase [Actinophytocola sp.]
MALELALDGTVVLVTGGARGVGVGITAAFRRAGATVITCGRRPPEAPVAEFVECDVREPAAVASLMDTVVARHGRLDTVVNNAGGAPPSVTATASPRFHEKVVGLNLLAPLLVAQRANEIMQRQDGGGAIVMVSSVSATRPSPGTAAYGAAKAGLDNLTATLAVEWAPKVRVNALDVGMVRTELTESLYGSAEAVARTVPLGRLADPEDVGHCAVFLASPLAAYVSGATLLVHGGGEAPAFLSAVSCGHGSPR